MFVTTFYVISLKLFKYKITDVVTDMKITYYGTSASEAWPALFCECEACRLARKYGGKNVRSRSQTLIDDTLLLDFPPDTNYHAQVLGLNLRKVRTLLITHSHHDHFFPADLGLRSDQYAEDLTEEKLTVYGNETVISMCEDAKRVYIDPEQYITFHEIQPFETFETPDGYQITALSADHNQPEDALIYLVEKEGKQILYAHDTGIFPESTWKFLEGKHLDLVSLDCTGLSRDWRKGHMGFQAVDEVRDRLKRIGCIDENTKLVLNHLAHHGDFTHEKICALENPKGYEVAYDGCSFEV